MAKAFSGTGTTVGLSSDRTAITSPATGMQFYESDTNTLYIYTGSAWVALASAAYPPGLSFIKTVSYSGANSANFDNVFNSSYDRYRVLIDPIVLSTNNTSNYMYMYMRSGGTNASTLYTYNHYGWSTSGAGTPSGTGYGEYQVGAFVLGNNYYGGMTMSLDFFHPYGATPTRITGTGYTNNGAIPYNTHFSGSHDAASSYDGFSIRAAYASSNISGSIRVYGYRNS